MYELEQASWSWTICFINEVLWKLWLIKKSCEQKEISGSIDISLVEYVDDILVTKTIYLHMWDMVRKLFLICTKIDYGVRH